MIFFGTKGKVVQGQLVDGLECPSCNNREFISFGVMRYFHLYWIPTLMTSRQVGIECLHCKKTLMDKEIPAEVRQALSSKLFTRGRIVPLFSGLILIAVLFAGVAFVAKQDADNEAVYIQQPMVNDLYLVDYSRVFNDDDIEFRHGVMRVVSVNGDKVKFQLSTHAFDRVSGVRKDVRDGNAHVDSYYDETMFMSLNELLSLRSGGGLHGITRP